MASRRLDVPLALTVRVAEPVTQARKVSEDGGIVNFAATDRNSRIAVGPCTRTVVFEASQDKF